MASQGYPFDRIAVARHLASLVVERRDLLKIQGNNYNQRVRVKEISGDKWEDIALLWGSNISNRKFLVRWHLMCLRPHTNRVVILAFVLCVEVWERSRMLRDRLTYPYLA